MAPSIIAERFSSFKDMSVSLKACVAEVFGTGLFVLIGLLSVVYSQSDTDLSNPLVKSFAVAWCFGIAITCMVYMTAHHSGGQLNPAITCGCVTAGVTTPLQGVANIISQCIGTVLSAAFVIALVPADQREGLDLGINSVPDTSTVGRAFLAEVMGMFIIVLVVLEVAIHHKSVAGPAAPLAIGLTFVIVIMTFGSVSSGGVNPARSFGPAVVSGNVKHLWIYIFGPVIGGVLAGVIHLASIGTKDTKCDEQETVVRAQPSGNSARDDLLP